MKGGRIQMSRVSLINQLYGEKKTALEFNFDRISIPPMNMYLSTLDIQRLYQIASSVRYAGNIDKKYEMIDKVMKHRSFHKLAAGTNRVVYYHLEDPRFVAKIAVDKVGLGDNPKEYKNQNYLKPFCTKIFEVDPTGVVAFVERVNPITSIEEFASIGEDVFNLITQKIIGKYVLDDIGVTKWRNYGCRMNGFGPVILDFPYVYELDGNKLYCQKKIQTPLGERICGGEIDYDSSFDFLVCSKCGKTYKARELENKNASIKLEMNSEGSTGIMTRARIIRNGKVYKDSDPTSKTYVSKEQFDKMVGNVDLSGDVVVDKVIHLRSKKRENKNRYQSELMMKYYGSSNATPTKINGIKKQERKLDTDRNKKYDSKIKGTPKPVEPKKSEYVQKQVTVQSQPVMEQPVSYTAAIPDVIPSYATTSGPRPTSIIRRGISDMPTGVQEQIVSVEEPNQDVQKAMSALNDLKNLLVNRPIPQVQPEVKDSNLNTNFKEAFDEIAQKNAEAKKEHIIEDIIADEDNTTKIETAIADMEAEQEEPDDVITSSSIELIMKGVYKGLTQSSYDEFISKEMEEEVVEEPPAEEDDYDEDKIEQLGFFDYRDDYRGRLHPKKSVKHDEDMQEY